MTETPDKSMDEILASIRRIVEDGPAPEAVVIDEVTVTPTPAPPPATAATSASSLEVIVREMLEPQLKAWLDAHLPELVERITRDEISRLSRG